MQRGHLDDLVAFVAVGQERSFTKAAAKLGVSQAALSHTIRDLEARLGGPLRTPPTRRAGSRPAPPPPRPVASRPPRRANPCLALLALGSRRSNPSLRPSATFA